MTANEIRKAFLDFFENKNHQIVPSAPMVIKDDPTLMFTNAGMNPFKDIFLGNSEPKSKRVADSQKCLRVSGKHNDLEEVGHDTYHHTMFEMLGNWSFGDYFKKEAISYAWEFLTEVCKIDKDRLYVTVFEGAKEDNTALDTEAFDYWKSHINEERILKGNKKDNFWEMGDTGPCGPCSEIHVDIRPDAERKEIPGDRLVNKDHPLVIEIWNLVFIQYNRKADGKLEGLPNKHIDTGMGFERLCMVVQNQKSNYDTDVFQPIIKKISELSNVEYGKNEKQDIAIRVIADHLRAVSFAIADGQLPSNNKAGYVIRRILRRAIRYAYTFLNQKETFINKIISTLVEEMGTAYPELKKQETLIEKVIKEEENSFLRTLENGIKKFENYTNDKKDKEIDGNFAFELYDTYGFPIDLTELMAGESGFKVNMKEFESCLNEQKNRSRKDAEVDTGDWNILNNTTDIEFKGYDSLTEDINITRYRKISAKGKDVYQLVFNKTPFYAEGGGQVGDKGIIETNEEKISIFNTVKENNLIIHLSKQLPNDLNASFKATVHNDKRKATAANHSATHLMHHALRSVLGTHVEQKGSLVDENYLRFDFSHFQKLTDDEILAVEEKVNAEIRQNISLEEHRAVSPEEANQMGAIALFGEKYGDKVRVIKFGNSVELCGGTHVKSTGEIGIFVIKTESAIAAGIRRIEALTGKPALDYLTELRGLTQSIKDLFKGTKNIYKSIEALQSENADLKTKIKAFEKEKATMLKKELKSKIQDKGEFMLLAEIVDIDAGGMKDIAFQLKGEVEKLCLFAGTKAGGKPGLTIMIDDNLAKEKGYHAGNMIREAAKEIKGGGGGQAFFATAGGKDINGLQAAIDKLLSML